MKKGLSSFFLVFLMSFLCLNIISLEAKCGCKPPLQGPPGLPGSDGPVGPAGAMNASAYISLDRHLSQTITPGAAVIFLEEHEKLNMTFSNPSSTVTIEEDGVYLVTFGSFVGNGSAGNLLAFTVNGNPDPRFVIGAFSTDPMPASQTFLIRLSQGDQITITNPKSSGNTQLFLPSLIDPFVTGYLSMVKIHE